jgi:hypothetical protein
LSWNSLEEKVREWEKRLNPEQKRAAEAIAKGWNEFGDDIFLLPIIDGPPGTGKTHVGVIGCAKYVLSSRETRSERPEVVYLCKTNFACERAKQVFFELGFTFSSPGTTLPDAPLAARIWAGIHNEQWSNGVVGWENMGQMDRNYLKMHHVLLATVDSARKVRELRSNPKMIIDEFSQVNAMDFFAAVERVHGGGENPKLMQGLALLGDPLQLPLVTTQVELRTNILNFLRMRFYNRILPRHELRVQYRMNKVICNAVNRIRKENGAYPLETADDVKNRKLEIDLPRSLQSRLKEALDPDYPLVLVDTSRLGQERRGFGQVAGDRSVSNPKEAELAANLAYYVMRSKPGEVKVLTPYSAQVKTIGEKLEKLSRPGEAEGTVSTIWSAQGQEWPCVIISMVRCNDETTEAKRWGFLGESILKAQIYVAVSRAQAKLIVLAAYDRTFKGHKDIDALWNTSEALHIRGEDLWY